MFKDSWVTSQKDLYPFEYNYFPKKIDLNVIKNQQIRGFIYIFWKEILKIGEYNILKGKRLPIYCHGFLKFVKSNDICNVVFNFILTYNKNYNS